MSTQDCEKLGNDNKIGKNGQPKATRQQIPFSVRMEMVRLKDANMRTKYIYDHFHGKYSISTICTQFSAEGRARLQKDIKNRATPTTTRTSYLRPPIIIDMEVVLYELIKKSECIHLYFTKDSMCIQAKNIIDFLNKSGDYDSEGQRCTDHNVVAEDVIKSVYNRPVVALSSQPDQPIDEDSFPHDPSKPFQCRLCGKGYKTKKYFEKHVAGHASQGTESSQIEKSSSRAEPPSSQAEPLSSQAEPLASHDGLPFPQVGTTSSLKTYYPFKASNGWLDNFKGRYNISSKILKGEQGSADEKGAELFVKEFTTKLSGRYRPREALRITINIDETGVQYKSVPSRSYVRTGTIIKAKKPVRARLTVLVGAAGDGYKFKLLVIGKAKRPMALRKVDMSKLPVHYANNQSAWMTEVIMTDWFTRHLIPEIKEVYGETKVIVTMDNCSAHPVALKNLDSNIEVEFLPPNTTSIIQPMDQCVIMSFKSKIKKTYFTKMVEFCLNNLDCPDPYAAFMRSYTIKDAIYDFADAWDNVSKETVKKSFNKMIDKNMLVRLYNDRVSEEEDYEVFSDIEDNPHSDESSIYRTSQYITGRLNQCAEERQDGTCYSQAAITDDLIYNPGVQDRDIANLVDEVLRQEDVSDTSDMQEALPIDHQEYSVIQQNIAGSLQKLTELDYVHDILGLTTLENAKYLEHLKGIREILNTSLCRNYPVLPQHPEPSISGAHNIHITQASSSGVRDTQVMPEEASLTDDNSTNEENISHPNEKTTFKQVESPTIKVNSWHKRKYDEDNSSGNEERSYDVISLGINECNTLDSD